MTQPRYATTGCAAKSQEQGLASSSAIDSGNAWIVSFNDGNSSRINRNNNAFVRAVRSAREYQGDQVSLRELHEAWRRARAKKVPSMNQLAFEANWIDGLLQLQEQINAGEWSPKPTTCFIAQRPKARQIHAPDFSDRVVHHWLVPKLEVMFERGFIHDSYANRIGKGTHAAVDRLRDFVHQVDSGQNGGWYLQLDVRNFFNTIHRPMLYTMLKRRMEREHASEIVRRATHALLRASVQSQGVVHRSSAAERALVPEYKRLENAAHGCGLPIGNLSSQFFANVYLDRLDQFVKHTFKAPRYLRYVDDFVLVHRSRAELEFWQRSIEEFLRTELRLELKPDIRLRPISAGIDFLGYVVFPTHTRVRRRVVRHAFAAVKSANSEQRSAVLASYLGHFSHADAFRLSAILSEKAA
jgi:hypothetical protein